MGRQACVFLNGALPGECAAKDARMHAGEDPMGACRRKYSFKRNPKDACRSEHAGGTLMAPMDACRRKYSFKRNPKDACRSEHAGGTHAGGTVT
eukprot:959242-Pelagomonas_calceolata.AAC.1